MLVKTMTYKDFNGDERTEDFYFNLSKAEIMEMQLSTQGGLDSYLRRIINTTDSKEIVKVFKDLILRSYGIKSDDGKRFIKSEELTKAFEETNAYSDLFMQLATDNKEAEKFINGIIDPSLAEEMRKQTGIQNGHNPNQPVLIKKE